MSRLRWPDSTNSVSEKPGTIHTESRVVTSTTTGRTYQISVALPRDYAESTGTYPVVYAVDANGEFGIVVESARLMRIDELVPPLIVVGVGYPVGSLTHTSSAPRT